MGGVIHHKIASRDPQDEAIVFNKKSWSEIGKFVGWELGKYSLVTFIAYHVYACVSKIFSSAKYGFVCRAFVLGLYESYFNQRIERLINIVFANQLTALTLHLSGSPSQRKPLGFSKWIPVMCCRDALVNFLWTPLRPRLVLNTRSPILIYAITEPVNALVSRFAFNFVLSKF
jgi:hypothetical protein